MTDYPVQCYNINGEPYGRYVNPHNKYHEDMAHSEFEAFAEANTFPFPSGTIGKTYERDEVEVVWQIRPKTQRNYWRNITHDQYLESANADVADYRQIFRLTQPVEKEPETVERLTCSCGVEGIKGVDVWKPFLPYYDTVICKSCWDKFQDWQKQQSK